MPDTIHHSTPADKCGKELSCKDYVSFSENQVNSLVERLFLGQLLVREDNGCGLAASRVGYHPHDPGFHTCPKKFPERKFSWRQRTQKRMVENKSPW